MKSVSIFVAGMALLPACGAPPVPDFQIGNLAIYGRQASATEYRQMLALMNIVVGVPAEEIEVYVGGVRHPGAINLPYSGESHYGWMHYTLDNDCLGASSFAHELLHRLRAERLGDPDGEHRDATWFYAPNSYSTYIQMSYIQLYCK